MSLDAALRRVRRNSRDFLPSFPLLFKPVAGQTGGVPLVTAFDDERRGGARRRGCC